MSRVMQISEAASLALHSMALLASKPQKVFSVKEIASTLNGSEAHLSKVLQRLARVGLVKSNRGPKGGFVLGKQGDEIALLEVYEAIEGPLVSNKCLFDSPICSGQQCIFGDLLKTTNNRYRAYLEKMKLSELIDVYEKEDADAERNYQDR
jgi:Rrf2 family protein